MIGSRAELAFDEGKVISIVTPSFNQGEFIEETIQSVLYQGGDFYIDFIINDGGSSDNSVEVIKKYQDLLRDQCAVRALGGLNYYIPPSQWFEWIRCLGVSFRWVSEEDQGQADAINKGMHCAKGGVVAFLNSDDIYYPGTLARISRLNWRNIDFAYGKGIWISKKGEVLLDYPTHKPTRHSLFYQCTLCQPTVFIRKDVFVRLGDFSLNYHCAFDYEYWLRAVFRDCKFKFVNAPLACSRMYETNKSLGGQERVSDEVGQLMETYYGQADSGLSPVALKWSYFTVQAPTVRRVKKLNELLGRGV
jgi:glycosyltransferase involved in cell wall biosynthesis